MTTPFLSASRCNGSVLETSPARFTNDSPTSFRRATWPRDETAIDGLAMRRRLLHRQTRRCQPTNKTRSFRFSSLYIYFLFFIFYFLHRQCTPTRFAAQAYALSNILCHGERKSLDSMSYAHCQLNVHRSG